MRHDVNVRNDVRQQIRQLAQRMSDWDASPPIDEPERLRLLDRIQFFEHNNSPREFSLAGVDGSGDFPAISYADSFVYVTVAHATIYQTALGPKLREIQPSFSPLIELTWIPEDEVPRREAWDEAFEALAGRPIADVITESDYQQLHTQITGASPSVISQVEELLRPHAFDSGNISIQLRTLGELGSALRAVQTCKSLDYCLVDTTMSLPMVAKRKAALFYEHVKRLCCVEALKNQTGFFAVSKSHGLPSIRELEQLAREKNDTDSIAEHWYLRIPSDDLDGWKSNFLRNRPLPPVGAVSYLFRFHKNVPVMRLDMDLAYWNQYIRGIDDDATIENECRVFTDLDFASHEQRAYGYPYPLKAGHDRASMTKAERVALRKQIIDAAVEAGMSRSVFRDASVLTGHG